MAQWWKRYEPILEQKPVTVSTALKMEIAKEVVEMLMAFPPARDEVAFESERSEARFGERLKDMPRPDSAMVRSLCTLLRLELAHDIEGSTHFLRNERFKESCPDENATEAFHFLWPYILELLHQRKDDCQGHLKRKDLPDIVDDVESRFLQKNSRLFLP